MIKCNIKACGTVTGAPMQKITNQGQPFTAFTLTVKVDNPINGETMQVPISVGTTAIKPYDISEGQRLGVSGTMLVRGSNGLSPFLNLWADTFGTTEPEKDYLTGDMEFFGTTGGNIQVKRTRRGKDFLAFSAYSSDKNHNGDRNYVWVRFNHFPSANQELQPTFIAPKAKIKVSGVMSVSPYKGRLSLSCRVSDFSEWKLDSDTTH